MNGGELQLPAYLCIPISQSSAQDVTWLSVPRLASLLEGRVGKYTGGGSVRCGGADVSVAAV
jgi:hypothetical protein